VDRCLAAGAELRSLHAASGAPADDWISAAISLELRARAWAGQVTGWEALAARLRTTGANLLESVDHQSSVAQLCLVAGRLDEAEARCRAALGALDENPDHSPDLVTLPRAVLGTVLLERGEAVAARSQFEVVATVASPTRRPATVLALIGLSRILRIEGAFEAALAVLHDARELLRHAPATSPMLIPIDASGVRTLLATGEVERARGVLEAMPPCPVRTALAVQVHLADGDPDAARRALADAPDARLRAEELDLAVARLLVELRTGGSAITELADEVLDHASSMRVTLPLAEAGSEVLAAMVTAARRRPQTPFLEAIQRTRPPAIPAGSATVEFEADALSERERTVLRYLVTAMSYREIADDLFVSVNTVKTHVRNILRKLQADSRAEAIDRARQLRYL
jgi:LuxR family maltose regulon positive regulatory protein